MPKTIEELEAELTAMKADSEKATAALIAQNEVLTEDNEKWKAKRAEAEKHLKKQEAEARKAAEEAALKSGDVEAVTKSWEDKYSALEQAGKDNTSVYEKIINFQTVETAAHQMASSIAMDGCDDLILPHIEARLYSEISDGKSVLKIKGVDGKPSALTLDELKTEFSENKAYERIIKGSSAGGNGMAGKSGGNGKTTVTRKEFDAMSQVQRGQQVKEHGAGSIHD